MDRKAAVWDIWSAALCIKVQTIDMKKVVRFGCFFALTFLVSLTDAGIPTCPPTQIYMKCPPCIWRCDQDPATTTCPTECNFYGCSCPNGTLWDGSACVETCPVCPANKEYSTCGTCDILCVQQNNSVPCSLDCKIGCFCPFNTFWDGSKCVNASDCPPTCTGNQQYTTCGSCNTPCDRRNELIACPTICRRGCYCPPNTYLDGDFCVAAEDCPPLPTPSCPSNQVFDSCAPCIWKCDQDVASTACPAICISRCTCPSGTLWDGNFCVDSCPICPGNQQFSTCGTCNTPCELKDNPPICTLECKIGCFCPFNTFLLGDQCVNATECPDPCPSNQVYDLCPRCIWQCGQDPALTSCPAECNPGCTCREGLTWDGTSCVEVCPTCPANQEYSLCGGCDVSCENKDTPQPCPLRCHIGCFCPFNTFWDGNSCVNATDCPPTCDSSLNEAYRRCAPPCDATCDDRRKPCSLLKSCNKRCACSVNHVRNHLSECVPVAQCLPDCPSNQVYDPCPRCIWQCGQDPASTACPAECNPGCTCPVGLLWDGTNCVEVCPTCPANQQYSMCGGCDIPCEYKDTPPPCLPDCKIGCFCPFNTYLDGNKCVNYTDCPPACPANQQYSTCGGCNVLCDHKDNPPPCTFDCKIGCFCPPDTFWDGNKCVNSTDCPPACPSNQVYDLCRRCIWQCGQDPASTTCPADCNPGCTCPHGLLWDGTNCVDTCPSCPANQQYRTCGGCNVPCEQKDNPLPCTLDCKIGCFCPFNTFWDGNKCVNSTDCPPVCDMSLNETFNTCAAPCDATCLEPQKLCSLQEICVPRCACPTGFVRNSENVCIDPTQCKDCDPALNEVWQDCAQVCDPTCSNPTKMCSIWGICKSRCACPDGYRRNSKNVCVSPSECYGCNATLNEIWHTCTTQCDATCDNPAKPCSRWFTCSARCRCPYGHVRNADNVCVSRHSCSGPAPCPPDQPQVQCTKAPCSNAECGHVPEAVCVNNYCGGCNADFYEDDEKISNEECNGCDPSLNEVWNSCAAPCDATCKDRKKPCSVLRRCTRRCACKVGYVRDHTAKCVPEKQCKPDCPSNQEHFYSKPCSWECDSGFDFFCRIYSPPGCACRPPTLWNGTRCVPSSQCPSDEEEDECPWGVPVASCSQLPCSTASCLRHPEATCTNNYCGGCNAIFSLDGEELDDRDCDVYW